MSFYPFLQLFQTLFFLRCGDQKKPPKKTKKQNKESSNKKAGNNCEIQGKNINVEVHRMLRLNVKILNQDLKTVE